MPQSAEAGRSTASRVFAVLDAFDGRRATMNLTQLATAAGLPLATTHRITRELLQWGAIERNVDGSFQIGLKLWEIGSLAPKQRDLRRVARPILDSLHEATGAIVQLAVLKDRTVLVLEKVTGSRSVSNITEIAGRLPLHAAAVGKVFLAFGPQELRESLPTPLPRLTPNTIVDPAALVESLQQTRRDLVARSCEEITAGTCSIAAPVFGPDEEIVGALAVLVGADAKLQRYEHAVVTAAGTISRRLGCSSGRRWPLRIAG